MGDVCDSLADIRLARQLVHYEPLVGFPEGLQRTIDYFRHALEQ